MKKNLSSNPELKLPHIPVMLNEVISILEPTPEKKYLDCTFGAGGYSKAILELGGDLIAIDQDPTTQQYAEIIQKKYHDKFKFLVANFSEVTSLFPNDHFHGIVLDLGVSSMQIDNNERGFSFMQEGPLDMRMGKQLLSASDFINMATEEELANIIYEYGGEHRSRRIAKAIISERRLEAITSTLKLAEIVRKAVGFKRGKIDQATKTFQAIRIYINKELEALKVFLSSAASLLKEGGKLVVVSFHSLEDSIVKEFFKTNSMKAVARSKYKPEEKELAAPQKDFKIITKKALLPLKNEIQMNPRARSARLRAALKIS